MSAKTIRVRLAATFYDDHVGRDLPSGIVIDRNQTTVLVDLDPEAFTDLMTDAEYYATMTDADRADNRAVCESAGRVLARLTRARRYWDSQVQGPEVAS